jgi:membrane protease YdiL (CAAX protease family)
MNAASDAHGPATDAPGKRLPGAFRLAEFFVLFALAPTLLAVFMRPGLLFPAIWALGALALGALLFDARFERRCLWCWSGVRPALGGILLRFSVCAPLLAIGLWALEPSRLGDLPVRNPTLWGAIMFGYPVVSVFPQEIAFRAFLFHRYAPLFRSAPAMVAASAAAFGYAHVILHNAWAVAFSVVGGVFFGLTYARSRSLAAACIEHALYGCFLFTIGWGWYFYAGSIGP